jgi:hypothetical protein
MTKEQKHDELVEWIIKIVPSLSGKRDVASYVVERFSRISEPPEENYMEMIVLGSGSGIGGGRSRKPGNVVLNWKRLFLDTPEHILTILGAASSNYLIPLAALAVWNKVRGITRVDLTENQAIIIAALWDLRDDNNYVDGANLLNEINNYIANSVARQFTQKELDQILRELSGMKAIELTTEGKVWLREWVQKPFY